MSQTFREQQTLSHIPPERADRMLAAPKPHKLTPAGRFWIGYAALVACVAWWLW